MGVGCGTASWGVLGVFWVVLGVLVLCWFWVVWCLGAGLCCITGFMGLVTVCLVCEFGFWIWWFDFGFTFQVG